MTGDYRRAKGDVCLSHYFDWIVGVKEIWDLGTGLSTVC